MNEASLKLLFAKIDGDGDGQVTKMEMESALSSMSGNKVSAVMVRALFLPPWDDHYE